MTDIHERLKEARVSAGFESARHAADQFGWSYSTYVSHENGQRGLKLDALKKYARAFRVELKWLIDGEYQQVEHYDVDVKVVPVVGKAAAGVWLEFSEEEYDHTQLIPAVPSPRYPHADQVAYKVEGPSMNRVIPDGAYAIGMLIESSRHPRHGDIVAAIRVRGGLMERTIKRYVTDQGYPQLIPESTDPRFQTPIVLESNEEDTEVHLSAIIIGIYQPL